MKKKEKLLEQVTEYADKSGRSGVQNYSSFGNSMLVGFKDDSKYLYTARKLGPDLFQKLLRRAKRGRGLNTLINKYIQKNHSGKL